MYISTWCPCYCHDATFLSSHCMSVYLLYGPVAMWSKINSIYGKTIDIYELSKPRENYRHFRDDILKLIFNCDQAALWMVQIICLPVHPSVRPPVTRFSLCSHHCIIIKFSGVVTNCRSEVYAKGQGQKSKVKITEVKPSNRFRTVISF